MHNVEHFPVLPPPEDRSSAADIASFEERLQLQRILESRTFARSPRLTRLLEHLCRKYFIGDSGQLSEYAIAVELFGRSEEFEPRADASVRVDINRLRRQLHKYYRTEGKADPLVLSIPPGQYAPGFSSVRSVDVSPARLSALSKQAGRLRARPGITFWLVVFLLTAGVFLGTLGRSVLQQLPTHFGTLWRGATLNPEASAMLTRTPPPSGPELRILAGSPLERQIDHIGNVWLSDRYFTGGSRITFPAKSPSASDDHEEVTREYAREGDFQYHIPLAPGVYELRLHFMERADRIESDSAKQSRVFDVFVNGKRLLANFDIAADAGGVGIPVVKVLTDVSPASDGLLHIKFISRAFKAVLEGIEILPGIPGKMRPVRIACRPTPYTGTDGTVWRADGDYRGGRLAYRNAAISGSQDPALFASERFGQFTYAIPVADHGLYTVILGFAETAADAGAIDPITRGGRLFDVFCNGQTMLKNFSIAREAGGAHRAITKVFRHLEPTAEGKILLEFVPVSGNACLNTIEVLSE